MLMNKITFLRLLKHFFGLILLSGMLGVNFFAYAQDSEGEEVNSSAQDSENEVVDSSAVGENNGEEEQPPQPEEQRRTVKLSPQIRILKQEHKLPVIAIEAIQQFLTRPKILTVDEINEAGYVVDNAEQSIFSTSGDEVYVDQLDTFAGLSYEGTLFVFLTVGNPLRDPVTQNILAYEATYLADGEFQRWQREDEGELAILKITNAVREIEKGAKVLPTESRSFGEDFYPHVPSYLEDCYIIGVVDQISLIGQYQVVTLNRGSEDGLERGHVLITQKSGNSAQTQKDSTSINLQEEQAPLLLPSRETGTLLVFKVFEEVSYALVTKATLPINLLDKVSIP